MLEQKEGQSLGLLVPQGRLTSQDMAHSDGESLVQLQNRVATLKAMRSCASPRSTVHSVMSSRQCAENQNKGCQRACQGEVTNDETRL